jgi:hypothetical protein
VGEDGSLLYQPASRTTTLLNKGTAGYFLRTPGTGTATAPTWATPTLTNILTQYSTTAQSFSSGLSSTILTSNLIQRMIAAGTYFHTQPAMGATLDTANFRFNINEPGSYRIQANLAVLSGGSTANFRILVAINGSQYSNSPTNSIFWCFRDTVTYNIFYSNITLDFHGQFTTGDFISILCAPAVSTSATTFLISNGATVSLTRIE